MNRIVAWLNLAYRFGLHVSWRLPSRWFGSRRDYERFRSTIASEGLVPLDARARATFPQFMHCIHCGLCTLACPALRDAPGSAWQEAWSFVGGASRSLEQVQLVSAALAPCTRCGECDAACPTGVPISLLAASIERLASSRRDAEGQSR